jgi:hypothetical protein
MLIEEQRTWLVPENGSRDATKSTLRERRRPTRVPTLKERTSSHSWPAVEAPQEGRTRKITAIAADRNSCQGIQEEKVTRTW